MRHTKWLVGVVLVVAVGVGGWLLWSKMQPHGPGDGFASANGRIEATEIDVATKLAGRIVDELVDEGDYVTAGQVVAHMDIDVLQAQLREAKARLGMAKSAVDTARSTLAQRESEKAAAESVVAQREADLNLATRELAAREQLVRTHAISQDDFDTEQSKFYSAKAAVSSAKANVAAADAAIATAKTLVIAAEAAVESTQATIERIQADINDSTLKAPRDGRVQYRVAQPGEVLERGRQGAEHGRSQRRLHDLLPAHGLGRPGQAGGRGPAGA